ncbi:MAG: amidase family protein [Rhodospirillaceae bacterium]
MNIRSFTAALLVSVSLVACNSQEAPKPYEVEEISLAQVSADLAAGKTTSAAVTQAYIDRIKMYDGPLNAVISITPDALKQAAASDARRKDGKSLGPLDGVPVLLKDNIDVTGVATTAGSYALENNLPAQDAEVSRRLKAAGAIILGKANTSQWAGFRTTRGLNGSVLGGGTHNPYDLNRQASGSSNGSGIAAAVSFAAATVGSDTTGSIVSPSSHNMVVGLRPSVALVSRRGVVPVSLEMDTIGPMGRSVTDIAMMLNVMAGSDAGDPWSADSDAHKTDYTKGLSTEALKGTRLGVVRNTGGYDEKTQAVLDVALGVLESQGATLVELPADVMEDLTQELRLIMVYNIMEDMAAYLAHAPEAVKPRTIADLIAFNKSHPEESKHGQELFEAAEATTMGRQNPEYMKTFEYARRRASVEGFDRAFKEFNTTAVVALTAGIPALIIPDGTGTHVAAERPKGSVPPTVSGTAAVAGYPNLSVPMGLAEGLPVGLSFVGPKWSEATLLAYGYAYEQASKKREAPVAYKQAIAQAK